jgi:hypothetical protein
MICIDHQSISFILDAWKINLFLQFFLQFFLQLFLQFFLQSLFQFNLKFIMIVYQM